MIIPADTRPSDSQITLDMREGVLPSVPLLSPLHLASCYVGVFVEPLCSFLHPCRTSSPYPFCSLCKFLPSMALGIFLILFHRIAGRSKYSLKVGSTTFPTCLLIVQPMSRQV
jgi:hypothetical protein